MRGAAVATPARVVTSYSDTRLLEAAAAFFSLAVLIHNGDHLRRGGDSVTADVFWIGVAAIVVEVGVVVLVFMRQRIAPLASTVAGFSLALGYLIVHFTPERSWLSDSFLTGDAAVVSLFAAALETAAALALGVVGGIALRRKRSASGPWSSERSLTSAMSRPVVLAMLLGNAVILVGSVLTR